MSDHFGPKDWRVTGKPVRFFIVDMRAAVPFLLCLLQPFTWWSWTLALLTTSVLAVLEWRGLTISMLGRMTRAWVSGPVAEATPWWYRRQERYGSGSRLQVDRDYYASGDEPIQ